LTLHVLALQHQVAVYQQTVHHPRVRPSDRLFWARLASHRRVCPATHGDRMVAAAISRPLAAPEPKQHIWPTSRC
jgi:hypothetical protein